MKNIKFVKKIAKKKILLRKIMEDNIKIKEKNYMIQNMNKINMNNNTNKILKKLTVKVINVIIKLKS